jgi:hypothetical protein
MDSGYFLIVDYHLLLIISGRTVEEMWQKRQPFSEFPYVILTKGKSEPEAVTSQFSDSNFFL